MPQHKTLASKSVLFAEQVERFSKPMELLDGLDRSIASSGLRVYGVWRIASHPLRKKSVLGETLYRHPSVPWGLHEEYLLLAAEHIPSATSRMARQNRGPFTFLECARASKAEGGDRWVFDLLEKHGIRDGFYCPVAVAPQAGKWTPGLWAIVFWSPDPLKLPPPVRASIYFMATQAAFRLEQLVNTKHRMRDELSLSPRELAVLFALSVGADTKEIATTLKLSEASVRTFEHRAMRKLDAKTRAHAVAQAMRATLF